MAKITEDLRYPTDILTVDSIYSHTSMTHLKADPSYILKHLLFKSNVLTASHKYIYYLFFNKNEAPASLDKIFKN